MQCCTTLTGGFVRDVRWCDSKGVAGHVDSDVSIRLLKDLGSVAATLGPTVLATSGPVGERGTEIMVSTREPVDVHTLPLAPKSPLSLPAKVRALRDFHTGPERLRQACGPVTRVTLGPGWLFPPIVVVTSPRGIRDVLGSAQDFVEKGDFSNDARRLLGGNLVTFAHDEWLPRRRSMQHLFTKQRVREFGRDMTQAAQVVCREWVDGAQIDLDAQCRKLTLKALGRSVLGLDLDVYNTEISEALDILTRYFVGRVLRPYLRAPSWLPTPARRRARNAAASLQELADGILTACRNDPGRDAPLVRALMAVRDPDTGRPLSDIEICNELKVFMLVGSDTLATTLTYALWQLGGNHTVQDRVRAEVHALGHADPSPEDVSQLSYTVQVLQEALRLCPPGASLPRTAMSDMDVAGYRVKSGTMLSLGIWAVHRDPELWHDPLTFDPDRFSPENLKVLDRWQYLPFGAGPRSCIGKHFAMLEATLALATIIGCCELDSLRDDFPVAVPLTAIAAEPVPALVGRCSVPAT